jgi:hypothetical protein
MINDSWQSIRPGHCQRQFNTEQLVMLINGKKLNMKQLLTLINGQKFNT